MSSKKSHRETSLFNLSNSAAIDSTFDMVLDAPIEALTIEIFGLKVMKHCSARLLSHLFSLTRIFKRYHSCIFGKKEQLLKILNNTEDLLDQKLKKFFSLTMKHLLNESEYCITHSAVDIFGVSHFLSNFILSNPSDVVPVLKGFGQYAEEVISKKTEKCTDMLNSRNFFLFYYLIGFLRKFISFTNNWKVKNEEKIKFKDGQLASDTPLDDEVFYLSSLVKIPNRSSYQDIAKHDFPVLRACTSGDIFKLIRKVIGTKLYDRLDEDKKVKLKGYCVGFESAVITSLCKSLDHFLYHLRSSVPFMPFNILQICTSVFRKGMSSEIFPHVNLMSSQKKLHISLKEWNHNKLFCSLDPCPNVVSVHFIDELAEKGYSPDLLRSVFFNTMFFYICYSLNFLRIFFIAVKHEEKYILVQASKVQICRNIINAIGSDTVRAHIEALIHSKVPEFNNSNATSSCGGTHEEQTHNTSQTENERIRRRPESPGSPARKKNRDTGIDESVRAEKKKNSDNEDDEIQMITPVKKPVECVTLDSEDDEANTNESFIIKKNKWKTDLQLIQACDSVPDYLKELAQHVVADNFARQVTSDELSD